MYMSYCRQEGTFAELRCALEDVQEHIFGEAEYSISDREIRAFKEMVVFFTDFLKENCILDDKGEIDERILDETCEAMSRSVEDDEMEWEENGNAY